MGFLDAVLGALKSFIAWFFVQIWYIVAAALKLIMSLVGWAATTVPYPKTDSGTPAPNPGSISDGIWGDLAGIYTGSSSPDGVGILPFVAFLLVLGLSIYGISKILDDTVPFYEGSPPPTGQVFWWFLLAMLWWPFGVLIGMFGQIFTNVFLCLAEGVVSTAGSACDGANLLAGGAGGELMTSSIDMISNSLGANPSFFLAALAIIVGLFMLPILLFAGLLWMVRIFVMYILFIAMPIMFALRPFQSMPGLDFIGKMAEKLWTSWLILVFQGIPAAILAAIGIIVAKGFKDSMCSKASEAAQGNLNSGSVTVSRDVGGASKFDGGKYVSNPMSSVQDVLSASSQKGPVLISKTSEGIGVVTDPQLVQSGSGCGSGNPAGQVTMIAAGLAVPMIVALGPWVIAVVAAKSGVSGPTSPLGLASSLDPSDMKETTEDKVETAQEYKDTAEAEYQKTRAGLSARETDEVLQDRYGWEEDDIEDASMTSAYIGSGVGSAGRGSASAASTAGEGTERAVHRLRDQGPTGLAKSGVARVGDEIEGQRQKVYGAAYRGDDDDYDNMDDMREDVGFAGALKRSAGNKVYDSAELGPDSDYDDVYEMGMSGALRNVGSQKAGEAVDSLDEVTGLPSWASRRQEFMNNPEKWKDQAGKLDAGDKAEALDDLGVSPAVMSELNEMGVLDDIDALSDESEVTEALEDAMSGVEVEDDVKGGMIAALTELQQAGGKHVLDDDGNVEESEAIEMLENSIVGEDTEVFVEELKDSIETDDRGRIESYGGFLQNVSEMMDKHDNVRFDSDGLMSSYGESVMARNDDYYEQYDSREEWAQNEFDSNKASAELISNDNFDTDSAVESNYDSELSELAKDVVDEEGRVEEGKVDEMRANPEKTDYDIGSTIAAAKNMSNSWDTRDAQNLQEFMDGSDVVKDMDKIDFNRGSTPEETVERLNDALEEKVEELEADELGRQFAGNIEEGMTEALLGEGEASVDSLFSEFSEELSDSAEQELKWAIESVEDEVGFDMKSEGGEMKIVTQDDQTINDIAGGAEIIEDAISEVASNKQINGEIKVDGDIDTSQIVGDEFESQLISEMATSSGSVGEETAKKVAEAKEMSETAAFEALSSQDIGEEAASDLTESVKEEFRRSNEVSLNEIFESDLSDMTSQAQEEVASMIQDMDEELTLDVSARGDDVKLTSGASGRRKDTHVMEDMEKIAESIEKLSEQADMSEEFAKSGAVTEEGLDASELEDTNLGSSNSQDALR